MSETVKQDLATDSYKLYEFSNNLGYIDEKIPDDVYKTILDEIDISFREKHPHNTKLVGNIEEQYYMLSLIHISEPTRR